MLRFVMGCGVLLSTLLVPSCVPLCGCSPPPRIATLTVEGQAQGLTGVAGAELPDLIVVAVRTNEGNGIGGISVTFTTTAPAATATPSTAMTDETGRARTKWRLGSAIGQQQLRITAQASGGFDIPNPTVTVDAFAGPPPR